MLHSPNRALAVLVFFSLAGCDVGHRSFTDGISGDETGNGSDTGGDDVVPGTTPGEGADPAPVFPYQPPAPQTSLRKVKQLVCGGATTKAEEEAYLKDATALTDLVDGWMKTDDYRQILTAFFSDQFQQSQALTGDYGSLFNGPKIHDAEDSARNSFARTAMALIDEGRPFSETMTTRRYMMTSELMSYYARSDTGRMSEAGPKPISVCRWPQKSPDFGPRLQKRAGPVSLSDAADPASANYLTFYTPNADIMFSNVNQSPVCRIDPLVFTDKLTVNGVGAWTARVYDIVRGRELQMKAYVDAAKDDARVLCNSVEVRPKPGIFIEADKQDWRMVEVRGPKPGENLTEFFDMPRIRNSNVVVMEGERLGFFTTPAFLAQWGNNASNSTRGTANQVLIVALGEQIDGADTLPLTTPTAVDPNHAADAACFACHQTLDPLRQFFRQSFTLSYSPQDNPNQQKIPAAFAFRGVNMTGTGVAPLAKTLAQHPNLARAWVVKLCSWANSAPCRSDDPEILRIAENFRRNNLNFNSMAKELFISPLITYASPTLTVTSLGQLTSIARQSQFCGTLEQRLKAKNLCQLATAKQDGKNTVSSRAAALPRDGYTRGSNAATYVTQPDPFYLGNLEGICALVASQAIDGNLKWAGSKDTNVVQRLAQEIMAIDADRVAEPAAVLQKHVDTALAAGYTRVEAVRSAFIVACSSSSSASIGQ